MDPTPQVTTVDDVQDESGYKAVQPPRRPPYWGIDKDPARRPGVPRMRDPQPWQVAELHRLPCDRVGTGDHRL